MIQMYTRELKCNTKIILNFLLKWKHVVYKTRTLWREEKSKQHTHTHDQHEEKESESNIKLEKLLPLHTGDKRYVHLQCTGA